MARSLAGEGAADDPVHAEAVKQISRSRSGPPRCAAPRHREERGRWPRAGRRPCRRVDPRADGRRTERPRPGALHGRPASAPARHRDAPGPVRRGHGPRRGGGGRDPERLAALYLLTKADAEATGPAAWTPWRRTLIRELVAKVQHVLDRGEMGIGARGGAHRSASDRIRGAPRRGVRSGRRPVPPTDAPLVLPERRARARGQALRDDRRRSTGVKEVRPSICEGVRAGHVRAAGRGAGPIRALVVDRGLAVARRHVDPHRAGLHDGRRCRRRPVRGRGRLREQRCPTERWREFRGTLRRAIDGSDLARTYRVDEKRRRYPAPRCRRAGDASQVDNDASDFATVIEVGASDRIGPPLRHDEHVRRPRARRPPREGRDVRGRVVDSFYVRDELGRKVRRPEERIARARVRLEPSEERRPAQADAAPARRSSSVARRRFAIFGPAPSSSCLK